MIRETEEQREAVRTYSATLEKRRGLPADMIGDEPVWIIRADPMTHIAADGRTRTSSGFPVLIVPGFVDEPEAFALKVAALLQEARF
jgi:hypothetical protein